MVECELLPPGFPPTNDIEIDLDALKKMSRQRSFSPRKGGE
jgi:hypothetical protein